MTLNIHARQEHFLWERTSPLCQTVSRAHLASTANNLRSNHTVDLASPATFAVEDLHLAHLKSQKIGPRLMGRARWVAIVLVGLLHRHRAHQDDIVVVKALLSQLISAWLAITAKKERKNQMRMRAGRDISVLKEAFYRHRAPLVRTHLQLATPT